ncbi:MAG: molecular chaperone DnaJ [Acidobacteriaceae bacterium]|jgi:molecular chaperone DnaJ|nr:molecular chaperone DnaJ [Acidobacteriaceae bacterium]
MPERKDYYGTLGVDKKASEDEIRKAYRRLARKYHPDLNPGDKAAEDKFKTVQEAYDILSEPKKRAMFDQYGFYSDSGFPPGGPPPGSGPGMGFEGFDFSDFVNQQTGRRSAPGGDTGGRFSDIFSQFFGGRSGAPPQQPEKGADLEYTLNIDFWQAIRGTQVRLSISRQESCATCHGSGSAGGSVASCPECNGTGQVSQTAGAMKFNLTCTRCNGAGRLRNVCPSCRGDGRAAHLDSVEVRLPAGVAAGSRLRVAGKGNAGRMGGPAGDLYITVRVEEHAFFKRDGDTIEIKVPVTLPEAVLGAKIEVPTIDGRAILKIPQGTQNGQKFRLREKGVPNSRKDTRGDQIVEVVLQAPPANDERTRELLRELAEQYPPDPRSELWTKV